jgi:predicted transposase YdaD
MQESVTYQAIKDEGRSEGIRRVAINLLREGMSVEMVARVTGLTVEQVQQLEISAGENQGE